MAFRSRQFFLCLNFIALTIFFLNLLETFKSFLASVDGSKLVPGQILVLLCHRLCGLGGGEAVCEFCNPSFIGSAMIFTS